MQNYTEIINKYFSGKLSPEEKLAFESSLATNHELKTEFEFQKASRGRTGKRPLTKRKTRKDPFKTKSGSTLIGVFIVVLVAISVWVIQNRSTPSEREHVRHELNEENNPQWSAADKHLAPEIFVIKAERDTVIETKSGIIFAIPAWGFLTEKGELVEGNIELEVKEAMNPLDIMKAGLSTTSGGSLLETGGMFYVNARQDATNLKVANNKGIYVSIPDHNPGKKMMLFEGKRMGNGQIDWVEPKHFENKLNPVDISTLNFYPPDFLDSLKRSGFDIKNKKLTDGIYYSFACTVAVTEDSEKSPVHQKSACEIDPSLIHAIWDNKYNNTLLATKAFEERLQAIFKTCNHNLLQLYVENIDKKMYEVDSMAIRIAVNSNAFEEFFTRRDGALYLNESHMKKLQSYVEEKTKMYKEAVLKTMNAICEKEKILDANATGEMLKDGAKEGKRISDVFEQELEKNLTAAYRQLGKKRPSNVVFSGNYRKIDPDYLGTTIVNMGWKNVDMFVAESTIARTTMNYKDRKIGKKAAIKYGAFAIKVNDFDKYESVYTYLVADQLRIYLRVPNKGSIYRETLNGLLRYSVVIFGFIGDEIYCKEIGEAGPGEESVLLNKMSQDDLERFRNRNQHTVADLIGDLNYHLFEQKEKNRKWITARREEVRAKLWPVVFPCEDKEITIPRVLRYHK